MPAAADVQPGTPIAVTKVRPPAARDLVPRPALVERLASGPPRRLTVIRAPAGWGKTTLLSAWAASPAEERPFAWLQLDATDSRPERFWMYVIEALRTVEPDLGGDALALVGAPGVDLEAETLPVLLNDLSAAGTPLVLVLDDYHLLDDPGVHRGVTFFVERLPPGVELAVATRATPPLPLARWRASGTLVEVDDAALRFSAGESASLLNGVGQLGLSPEQVEALYTRTEGWAAGLYLAALSLRDHPDPPGFIAAFSGDDRHVVDYLSSEVLGGLQQDLRDFLVRTSILDRLTGPLCDAVTQTTRSARLLREIERSNLFVVALDDRRHVYRYHHLFADLLRAELELSEPELVADLHRRAADWHLAAADADRAIRHTIAAGDLELAAELVAEHWPAYLLNRGEHLTIDGWLAALPPALVRGDARLSLARVYVLHSVGDTDSVMAVLDDAEAALAPDAPETLRFDVAVTRASTYVQLGDNARALAGVGAARALDGSASVWRPIPDGVRAHALRWAGDPRAEDAFEDYLRVSEACGQVLGVLSSYGSIGLLAAEQGRWEEAEQRTKRSVAMMVHGLGEHWTGIDARAAEALVAEHHGDTTAARHAARRAVELVRRGGVPGGRANALLHAAAIVGGAEGRALIGEAAAMLAPCVDPGSMVVERLADAQAARGGAQAEPGDALSDRELAVLRLLASDLSQREIGEHLYVSLNTVKTHARHIFRKLGAAGRDEAVARAREAGLLR